VLKLPGRKGAPLRASLQAKQPMMPEYIVFGLAKEDITIATR
jgi:hypothetical protein